MAKGQGFGANTPGLWASLDPVGCSLKMSVLCELEGLTGCALTWRLRDTPSGRLWWVLGRSEPLTGGSESGSWPTVTQPYGNNRGGGMGRVGPVRPSLESLARSAWPSATAGDAKASGSKTGTPRATSTASHPGTTLTDAANGLWASPLARDWKDSGPTQGNRKSPNLGTQVHDHGKQLANQAAMFPSPKASDGRSKGTGGTPDHGFDAMARAGLLDQGSHSTSGRKRAWPSPAAQTQEGGPRLEGGAAGRAMLKGTELEPGTYRGVLNSRWVAQLMGYPPDWCDLPAEAIERLSRRSETASSRR